MVFCLSIFKAIAQACSHISGVPPHISTIAAAAIALAAPTAGSCGILPAALLTIAEERNIPDKDVVMALFTASAVGLVIANKASISGIPLDARNFNQPRNRVADKSKNIFQSDCASMLAHFRCAAAHQKKWKKKCSRQ